MNSYTEGLHITDNPACNEFMRGEWGSFPKVQFDCGLGAELSGETVDINKDALRETLEKIGVPEERWGDITLTVTSNKKNRLICQRIWRVALIPPRTAGLRLQ